MIVFPAIDLRKGRCVRLVQGDPDRETVFDDDPVAVAHRWKREGADWLHVVNLDGALGQAERSADNVAVVSEIVSQVGLSVQFGGGLRRFEDVDYLLSIGVSRVVFGTIALSQPELIERCVRSFGVESVALALDARDGKVATHGWQTMSQVAPVELARQMRDRGVEWVIYTDIARDGMLEGVNVPATTALARETGMRVVASGGVASTNDIRRLKASEEDGIRGVIIGKSLYTGQVNLGQAINIAGSSHEAAAAPGKAEE